MGHIINEHLANLWDFMASYSCKSGINPSDILNAFLECDEALSELVEDRDRWKTMYYNACVDQDVLKESIRLLDKANNQLKAENDDLKKRCADLRGINLDIVTKNCKDMRQLREEKDELKKKLEFQQNTIEGLRKDRDHKAEAVVKLAKRRDDLQKENNDLRKRNAYQAQKDDDGIKKLDNLIRDLQKENNELNKDCEYMTNSRNTWRTRAKHAEAEVEDLKKQLAEANNTEKEYEITFTMDKAECKELMKLLCNKAYGALPEYMRDSLKEFCDDHASCFGCPLRFSDCDFDGMSDEELEKLYKIAINSK